MTQFKYPHFLLGTVVAGLWFAGEVYATQSPLTPGPSVGHRPEMSDLVLGTNVGDITLSTTQMLPGETVKLLSVIGGDVDDDVIKAGAYCIWYKVAVGGGTPILIQDKGPADLNCEYTIQPSDVGFHIQGTVKLYSDQDIATTKGYAINPKDSLPIEVLSSRIVTTPYPFNGMQSNGVMFTSTSGFPTTGFANAAFQLLINGSNANNKNYTWISENPSLVNVNADGIVTLKSKIVSDVNIVAVDAGVGYTLRLKIDKWYSIEKNVSYSTAVSRCPLPTALELSAGSGIRRVGSVWGEWGASQTIIGGMPVGYQNAWTKEPSGANQIVIGMNNGGRYFTSKESTNRHIVLCKR